VWAQHKLKAAAARYRPAGVAGIAVNKARSWPSHVRAAIEEGRSTMRSREAELRDGLVGPHLVPQKVPDRGQDRPPTVPQKVPDRGQDRPPTVPQKVPDRGEDRLPTASGDGSDREGNRLATYSRKVIRREKDRPPTLP
jgi:hypothetical protein